MQRISIRGFLATLIAGLLTAQGLTADEVVPSSLTVEVGGVTSQPADSEVASDSTLDLLPVASLDPAFDRYVDLSGVRAAIAAKDAVWVTDVAMQLAEGEKALLRVHKTGVSASHLLGKAALIASAKQDKAALDRLSKVAESMSDKALSDQLLILQSDAGVSRSAEPSLTVSLESMDVEQAMLVRSLLDTIKEAELVGDLILLDSVEADLKNSNVPAEQKGTISRSIVAARAVIPVEADPLAAFPGVSRDLLSEAKKQINKNDVVRFIKDPNGSTKNMTAAARNALLEAQGNGFWEVKAKNNQTVDANICVVYMKRVNVGTSWEKSIWVKEGWKKVSPGQTVTVFTTKNPHIAIFAQYADGRQTAGTLARSVRNEAFQSEDSYTFPNGLVRWFQQFDMGNEYSAFTIKF